MIVLDFLGRAWSWVVGMALAAGPAGTPPGTTSGGTGSLTLMNPLGSGCASLGCPTEAVISFIYTVSLPICVIMVLWGGILMATSAGDPEKFGRGKKTLLYAAIGFMVILLAAGSAKSIQNFLAP